VRGALNRIAELTGEERARGVISISAGNHAKALAWAAREEGLDALIVMWQGRTPSRWPPRAATALRSTRKRPIRPRRSTRLDELIEQTGRTLVHPFNDEAVIAGQGTVALELLEDVPDLDLVVVPCGGGGLVSGMAVAVRARWPKARIVASSPKGLRLCTPASPPGTRARDAP